MSGRRARSIPKVKDLPFFDSLRDISHKDKVRLGIICTTGNLNEYRINFILGRGGSRKEETWDRKNLRHTCCDSKVPWRHKKNCPRLS